MATGRPGPRYIGDGVCAGFDSCQIVQETQDGCRTTTGSRWGARSCRAWTATGGTTGTSTRNGGRRGRNGRNGPWAYRRPRGPAWQRASRPAGATRHARPRHRRLRAPRDLLGNDLPTSYQKIPGPGDCSFPSSELPGTRGPMECAERHDGRWPGLRAAFRHRNGRAQRFVVGWGQEAVP